MRYVKNFTVILMISVFALGMVSCQTTKKSAATEEAIEVQPSAEELERQNLEEEEMRRQAELERMRQEELAQSVEAGYAKGFESEAEAQSAREIDFDPSTILSRIHFDYDKYDLRAGDRDTLSRNAEWIKANPDYQIQIEGHCDERGSDEYNLALGERRATAAKNYLISLGVDESRLFTISYGEEMPEDTRHDEDAWATNRRAEFKVATP